MTGPRVKAEELPFGHMALTLTPCDECDRLCRPEEATLNCELNEVIGISSVYEFHLVCGHSVTTEYLRENYQ